jgi:hypothetical protein
VSIIVKTALDERLAIGGRGLLRVVAHNFFRLLSGRTNATVLLDWLHRRVRWVTMVNFLSCAHGAKRRWEAGADCLDHLGEPEEVEQVERDVRRQVRGTEPERQVAGLHEGGGLAKWVVEVAMVRELGHLVHEVLRCGVALVDSPVDVVEDQYTAVVTPNNATAEEGRGEERAVDSLVDGTGQVELVAEPVDVQKRTRKLVQEEDGRIVVEERAL